MVKTIKVSEETHMRLGNRVKFGYTLEDVIIELLDIAIRREEKEVMRKK